MTGGSERTDLVGKDQLLMSVCLSIWPDASLDQLAAFIFNNGGSLYSREAISHRMKELKLTKKKASVEAYQAFLPINVLKAELFWSQPPPLGIVGLETRCLIDADEMAVCLDETNKSYGHAHCSIRIRKPGHYVKDQKLTVIMAVEPGDPNLPANVDGSIQNPRHWIQVRKVAGTTALDFANFLNYVCGELETPHPARGNLDDHRCFLYDNLSSHLSPIIAHTVENRPSPNLFHCVRRPPYQPKYGPIEYVFAELAKRLEEQVRPHWDDNDLMNAIRATAANLGKDGKFHNTFVHCGYT